MSNAPAGRRLYVYYRVAESNLADVRVAARAMQADLAARHRGLHAELLRRPGSASDGQVTLMEIYADEAGIGEAIGQDIERAANSLAGWLQGPRQIEVFENL